MGSDKVYTIRFGVEMLMSFFLDERFKPEYCWAAALRSEEYYVNMMIAWFFATALAKQYEAAAPYLSKSAWRNGPTTRLFKRRWKATASAMTKRPI